MAETFAVGVTSGLDDQVEIMLDGSQETKKKKTKKQKLIEAVAVDQNEDENTLINGAPRTLTRWRWQRPCFFFFFPQSCSANFHTCLLCRNPIIMPVLFFIFLIDKISARGSVRF